MRRGITLVPEGRLVFPQMTVMENLQLGAHIKQRGEIAALVDYAFGCFRVCSSGAASSPAR